MVRGAPSLLYCAEMSFDIQHGVLKAAAGDVATKLVLWCLDNGPPASEVLALRFQADSPGVRILSLLLLAGSIPTSIIHAITNPSLRSAAQLARHEVGPHRGTGARIGGVGSKGPTQDSLPHQLKSKDIMVDALGAIIHSGKQSLVEWSSSPSAKGRTCTPFGIYFSTTLWARPKLSRIWRMTGLWPCRQRTREREPMTK